MLVSLATVTIACVTAVSLTLRSTEIEVAILATIPDKKARAVISDMRHEWHLIPASTQLGSSDRFRRYKCAKCDAGPFSVDILSGKTSLTKAAKNAGISADCKVEIVKKVMEE